MELNEYQIMEFIEKYGDGDIYFSHYKETDGTIIVKYLPKFTHFADEDNILLFKKELREHPHLKPKYLAEIILTDKFAYIPNGNNKNPLVENYKAFLEEIKAPKFAVQSEACKEENIKETHRGRRDEKGGQGRGRGAKHNQESQR